MSAQERNRTNAFHEEPPNNAGGTDLHNTAYRRSHTMNNCQLTQDSLKEQQKRTFEECHKKLGENHPDTLAAMNLFALTLRDTGDYTGAKVLQKQLLEKRRKVLGEDHPDTLTAMDNLAGTLRNMGDFASAKELQEQALEKFHEQLGENHRDTLTTMNNLASTLDSMGDYNGSLD